MRILTLDPERPDPVQIGEAAAVIRSGGLVAFPTETVYGLGANALDPEAIERIFAAKGRPAYNPLIAHAADADAARELSTDWSPAAGRLAEAFWPGPLTLVVPRRPDIPARLTAGLPTVALRVPRHPVALALLEAAGVPIAAPSANPFTRVSPTLASHVVKGLGSRVDMVLDAGPAQLGIESTVVDVSGEQPILLRPGTIPASALEEAVGMPLTAPGRMAGNMPRPGPGMVDRHYSPRARLILLAGDGDADLPDLLRREGAAGRKAGALLLAGVGASDIPATEVSGGPSAHIVRLPNDPYGYARELYAALHTLDDAGCDAIFVQPIPTEGAWAGVGDRLRRASHHGG